MQNRAHIGSRNAKRWRDPDDNARHNYGCECVQEDPSIRTKVQSHRQIRRERQ
jgi:hypothetical protein